MVTDQVYYVLLYFSTCHHSLPSAHMKGDNTNTDARTPSQMCYSPLMMTRVIAKSLLSLIATPSPVSMQHIMTQLLNLMQFNILHVLLTWWLPRT